MGVHIVEGTTFESLVAVALFAVTVSIDEAAFHGELRLPSWVISGSPDAADLHQADKPLGRGPNAPGNAQAGPASRTGRRLPARNAPDVLTLIASAGTFTFILQRSVLPCGSQRTSRASWRHLETRDQRGALS
jgi:hypothetical protein